MTPIARRVRRKHAGRTAARALLQERGDPDGAEQWYRRAIGAGNPVAMSHLGALLQERGDLDGAERLWRRAADAGNTAAMAHLGALFHERGDPDEAEYAHAFRDLGRVDESRRFASISADEAARQHRARRGSLAQATLTRAALEEHDLESAATSATLTVELAAAVRSSRSIEAVQDLRQRFDAHRDSPAVIEFLELADTLLPQAS